MTRYFGRDDTYPDHFYIGGEWVRPAGDGRMDLMSPATGERYHQVALADAADVTAAVAAARRAFDRGPWPRLSPAERASCLRTIGALVAARSHEFADIWSREVGVVNAFANMVVPHIAGAYQYYAAMADSFAFEEAHETSLPGGTGLLVREPVGVVVAIVPWNAPLALITYKIAPALLAGCTIILKAPPEAPATAFLLAELIEEAGLPPGVVNILTADGPVSERLVRHPDVDKVTFTGSSAVGRRIATICGERMARCTTELGGKSAALILDDCDMDMAAAALARSAVVLTGQVCSSLTRIIVPRGRQADFVGALADRFAAVKIGDPYDGDVGMGPLATARQLDRVRSYIDLGRAEGAMLAAGGDRPAHLDKGYYISPTIFRDVDNDMRIAREEIFGPVLCVIPADSEQQAIDIANASMFGLNASIFTPDADRAYAIGRQLRCGTVGHNGHFTETQIAAGGFKQSGIGREGGVEGLLAFTEAKTLVLARPPRLPS